MSDDSHESYNPDCWCCPRLCTPCPACEGGPCWRCGGEGLIDVPRDYADGPLMVIHHDALDEEAA